MIDQLELETADLDVIESGAVAKQENDEFAIQENEAATFMCKIANGCFPEPRVTFLNKHGKRLQNNENICIGKFINILSFQNNVLSCLYSFGAFRHSSCYIVLFFGLMHLVICIITKDKSFGETGDERVGCT